MNNWTEKDLEKLTGKGLKIDDDRTFRREAVFMNQFPEIPESQKVKIKIEKRSLEKDTIHAILDKYKLTKLIDDYQTELRFDDLRKFRFDYAIPSLKIAIEYEGIFSKKSRHTTVSGFSEDCIKYNLAVGLGWRVLRYTAKNYLDLEKDLNKML